MEAANLGAYLATEDSGAVENAVAILARSPEFGEPGYHEQALKVMENYPVGHDSLAIPTWFYGHEPSNLFATRIAKYFSNGIREDVLLAVSIHGVVFAPGSAGTTQEVFMDATQNHYATFGWYSPMVFLGSLAIACAPTALQLATPNQLRAQVSAIYMFSLNIISSILGPTGVGVITDYVFKDEMAVGASMALVVGICMPLAALVLWLGRAPFRDAVEQRG